MVSASMRSNATVPSPSHSGRYTEMNGISASCTRMGESVSVSVVTMCSPVEASASSEVLRCRRP